MTAFEALKVASALIPATAATIWSADHGETSAPNELSPRPPKQDLAGPEGDGERPPEP